MTPLPEEICVISRADTELTVEQSKKNAVNMIRLGKYIEKIRRSLVYKKSGENEFLHQIFTQILFLYQRFSSHYASNRCPYASNNGTNWSEKESTKSRSTSYNCSSSECPSDSKSFHNSTAASTTSPTMTFLMTSMSSTSCHMLKFKNEYNLCYF